MADTLTTVIDRNGNHSAPPSNRRKRIWLIITACIATLALTATAILAIFFYLNLQDERRLAAARAQQITSLQQTLSEQSAQLESQQQALSSLQSAANSQESVITSQESVIASQESAIVSQESVITSQNTVISNQQNTIKKLQSNTTKKPTTTSAPQAIKEAVSYSNIDVTALKDKKLVALTFDDGPGPYTATLLDTLKARGARATFFVVGSRVNSYSALVKRMETEGHVVGNHTQNHKNLNYLSSGNLSAEIGNSAERINNIIGHYPLVMRCPGGNYNTTVRNHVATLGIPIIQWSVDPLDWRDRNATTVFNRVKNATKDGSIVLLHDIHSTTVNAAGKIIDDLQSRGYTLVTVPELLMAKYGTVEAGKVYYHG